jgi:hypothetical protein
MPPIRAQNDLRRAADLATWLLALQTLAVLNSCLVLLLNGVLRRLIHLQGSCLLCVAKQLSLPLLLLWFGVL